MGRIARDEEVHSEDNGPRWSDATRVAHELIRRAQEDISPGPPGLHGKGKITERLDRQYDALRFFLDPGDKRLAGWIRLTDLDFEMLQDRARELAREKWGQRAGYHIGRALA